MRASRCPRAAWVDALLLLVAYACWAVPWLADAPLIERVGAFSLGAAVLHAWAGSRLMRSALHRHSLALKSAGPVHGRRGRRDAGPGRLRLLAPQPAAALRCCRPAARCWRSSPRCSRLPHLLLTYERTERELRASRRRLRVLANIDMLTRVPTAPLSRNWRAARSSATRPARPRC
jgi:hypothetical protein